MFETIKRRKLIKQVIAAVNDLPFTAARALDYDADVLVVTTGKAVLLKVILPLDETTEEANDLLTFWSGAGAITAVVDSVEGALRIVNETLDRAFQVDDDDESLY